MKRVNRITNEKTSVFKIALAIVFALVVSAIGGNSVAQVRSGVAFLKILPGARQQSMSGSLTGLLDEDYAYYANPAATGFAREWQYSLTYTKWITDIYNISLNYGRGLSLPWNNRSRIMFGVNYQGVKEFDSSRGATPPASASDLLALVSVGSSFPRFSRNVSFGINAKYFRSNLAQYTANAVILDMGVLYRTHRFHFLNWKNGLFKYGIFSAGLAVTQLGNSMRFIDVATPLPRTYRGGVAFYTGTHNGFQIQLSLDVRKIRDEKTSLSLGSEISLGKRISIRGGYNFQNALLSKYSFGMGIRLDDYSTALKDFLPGRKHALKFDIAALQNMDFFSNASRISVTDYPIGPEKFEYQTPGKIETYTTEDSVTLRWQVTRDPDLFDEVQYGFYLTKDSLSLANYLKKLDQKKVDLSQKPEDAVVFALTPSVKIHEGKERRKFRVELSPLPIGNYFWSVWARDDDDHIRFAVKSGQKIQHFRVIAKEIPVPPDTTADLMLAKTAALPPLDVNIHFPFDSARLTPRAKEMLNILGMALNSKELRSTHVELGGHTDKRGSAAYNLRLSQRRVDRAKDYLIAVPAVDSSRLTAIGYGESRPLIKNATTEAEFAINRRVEIKLSRQQGSENSEKVTRLPVPKTIMAGKEFSYKINVKNKGPRPARSISIKDKLPSGIKIVSTSIQPDSLSGNLLFWKFDSLATGDSLVIVLKAKAPDFVDRNPKPFLNKSNVTAINDTSFFNNVDSVSVLVIGTPDTAVYFGFDSSNVRPQARKLLEQWANFIEASPRIPICIEGHTDSIGSDAYNMRLSIRRAKSVKKWLITWLRQHAASEVKEVHIYTIGYGERRPIATNKTEEGRQKNRRIVIHPRPCK
ncbi:MAG: PorV/PorQ family protein [Calditrichaeota bacterium]|nr:PorV/PorQ family protein [Calditrichota bacterium]